MSIITKEFLEQIGINLDDQAIARLSDDIEEELYQRVIKEIIDLSDNEEDIVAELRKLADMSDIEAQKWLRGNVEDFDDIVQDEVDILLGELAEKADSIV